MNAKQFKEMVNALPDSLDVVVGDPDTGRLFEPAIDTRRYMTLWRVSREDKNRERPYLMYYENRELAERDIREQPDDVLSLDEVSCVWV